MNVTDHGMGMSSVGSLTQLFGQWDAPDMTLGSGTLTTDTNCWKGQNAQYAQPSAGMVAVTVASVSCNKLRFGHFSVGFRIKCSNITSASAVVTLKVLNSSGTAIATAQILGTDFAAVGANVYKVFYVAFDNLNQSTGNAFTFSLTSEAIASTVIAIDSIIVAPIHLANFGQ